jgi:hypothetical protein
MGRKKQLGQQRRFEEEKLEEIKLEGRRIQKKIIIAAASVIAGLAIGYSAINSYLSKNQEKGSAIYAEQRVSPDLERARANPNLRQAYLESLVSSNDIPYSSGVIYDPDGQKMLEYYRNLISNVETNPAEIEIALEKVRQSLKDPNTPIKTPEFFDLSGQGIKPPIYVNKLLFEANEPLCSTSEDMAHVIRYHEGRHAEQFSVGLIALGYLDKGTILRGIKKGDIIYELVYGLGEIDALNSELSAIEAGKSRVSKKMYEKALGEYRQGRALFEKALQIDSPVQQELIKKVLNNNPKR